MAITWFICSTFYFFNGFLWFEPSRRDFFTDFNFQKIADYYDQQTDEVKDLFEELGMVILAPKDALKRGFINLKNEITDECGSMF